MKMKVMINGEMMELPKPLSVTELLKEKEVASPDMVSVQLNEEILAKNAFDTTLLQENDTVEFLYFMGGGAERYERFTPGL